MFRLVLPCLLAITGVLTSAATAGAAEFVPGELIVRFKPGVSGSERADARRDQGATVDHALPVPGTQVVELPAGRGVRSAAAEFEDDPRVAYAEPNYIVRASVADPANPTLERLWGLNNDGLFGGLADADIDANEGWAELASSPAVKVAVVDSGIDMTHQDLASRISGGMDFVDGGTPQDGDGHGTHVSGIVGAAGGDGYGVTGVSHNVQIVPLRVLDDNGEGFVSHIALAIHEAKAQGASIVNLSLGALDPGEQFPQSLHDAIEANQDLLVVAAAGNAANDNDAVPDWPCNYVPDSPAVDNVICVAASDRRDAPAPFTSYGRTMVDLAAPGVDVLSSYPRYRVSREEFATGPAGWTSSGTGAWVSSAAAMGGDASPGLAIAPSDPYGGSSETVLQRNAPVDLAGSAGCEVVFDFGLAVDDAGGDVFTVEGAPAAGGPWTPIYSANADVAPQTETYVAVPEDLTGAALHLRLRFVTDAANAAGGPFIGPYFDFLDVDCAHAELSGTSMAAPHVSGAAALVLAQSIAASSPLTSTGLKQRLLTTVDPLPCWDGLTATEGRLNLARALGSSGGLGDGATDCPVTITRAADPPPATPPPAPPAPPSPTPTGPDPGTDGRTPAPGDITPPAVTASAARRYRSATLLGRGLRARLGCDEACSLRADVLIGRRTAKRLGISGPRFGRSYIRIGRSRATLSSAGSKIVITRISRGAHRGLLRARSVRLVLRVLASDEHGNDRVTRRTLTVRR